MKKSDVDQVRLVIREEVHTAIAPLRENQEQMGKQLLGNTQTLYGPNGNNGLCGDVKYLKSQAEDYRQFKGKIAVIGAISATVFGFAGTMVSKILKIGQ